LKQKGWDPFNHILYSKILFHEVRKAKNNFSSRKRRIDWNLSGRRSNCEEKKAGSTPQTPLSASLRKKVDRHHSRKTKSERGETVAHFTTTRPQKTKTFLWAAGESMGKEERKQFMEGKELVVHSTRF